MKEFFVGLLALLVLALLSVIGIFMFPFIVVLGFFLKWIISILFVILAIWLVGKVVLLSIESLKSKEKSK